MKSAGRRRDVRQSLLPVITAPCDAAAAIAGGERRAGLELALQPGEGADRAGDGRHVVVGVALADQPGLDRLAQRADRQRRAVLPGKPERAPEVLAVERDLEPERVVVG